MFERGIKNIAKRQDIRLKLSNAGKKRHPTQETIEKIRKAHLGKVPWNKGKTGIYSETTLQRMSDVHKEKGTHPPRTVWHGDKHPMFGKHHSINSRKKMSGSHKGQTPWNKGKKGGICPWREIGIPPMLGKKHTDETKSKMSISSQKPKPWLKGENHFNWKGGISFIPYCFKFNLKLKERIRERDNRTCQLCGDKENGRKLAVHHIHYDKENCEPDLIALCLRCNIKVNQNRDYYELLFIELLTKRGLIPNKQPEKVKVVEAKVI